MARRRRDHRGPEQVAPLSDNNDYYQDNDNYSSSYSSSYSSNYGSNYSSSYSSSHRASVPRLSVIICHLSYYQYCYHHRDGYYCCCYNHYSSTW